MYVTHFFNMVASSSYFFYVCLMIVSDWPIPLDPTTFSVIQCMHYHDIWNIHQQMERLLIKSVKLDMCHYFIQFPEHIKIYIFARQLSMWQKPINLTPRNTSIYLIKYFLISCLFLCVDARRNVSVSNDFKFHTLIAYTYLKIWEITSGFN